MSETDMREVVRETVIETLAALGLDLADPHDLRRIQADFAYLRRARESSEEAIKWIRRTAIGVVLSGALVLLWQGLREALRVSGVR